MSLAPTPSGSSELFQLLRDGVPRTRAELASLAGLARSTVGLRVEELLELGLVRIVGDAISSGGRPAYRFAFDPDARLVLAVDLGARHQRVAITDLASHILASDQQRRPLTNDPSDALDYIVETTTALLADLGRDWHDVVAAGIGLPGPVEHATGRPVQPPIMPGWDGFDVPGWMYERLGIPALVDNDVNIMAIGERTVALPGVDDILFVKVATGIGAGIVSGGMLQRGVRGTAGDIGHVRVARGAGVHCDCGREGCLEALASGGALARALGVATAEDVAALIRAGDADSVAAAHQAGRDLGEVLATCVSLMNPSTVVIGSTLALPEVLEGIHEVLFDVALPNATSQLSLVASVVGEDAGVIGASVLACEHVLSPEGVDELLAR